MNQQIATDSKPCRPTGLIWHETEDGTVIVSPTAGKVRVLNNVGTAVWELMDGQHSVPEIKEALLVRFQQVPPERITQDLSSFLHELSQRSLVEWR